jgi:hypothetical protein
MTVEFELDGERVVAINGGPQFQFSEAISLMVNCADQQEVDYYWERLGEGGEEGPVRLAEGPLRPVLAGRPRGHGRGLRRPRSRPRRPGDAGDAPDGQARRRHAQAAADGVPA